MIQLSVRINHSHPSSQLLSYACSRLTQTCCQQLAEAWPDLHYGPDLAVGHRKGLALHLSALFVMKRPPDIIYLHDSMLTLHDFG